MAKLKILFLVWNSQMTLGFGREAEKIGRRWICRN